MIIEWIFDLIAGLVNFFLGLLPDLPDSSWLSGDVASAVSTISGYASQLGNFVPWGIVESCIGLILATLAVAAIIKVVRIIASFLTVGGGSAA